MPSQKVQIFSAFYHPDQDDQNNSTARALKLQEQINDWLLSENVRIVAISWLTDEVYVRHKGGSGYFDAYKALVVYESY